MFRFFLFVNLRTYVDYIIDYSTYEERLYVR